eukprot:COSAG06_NODE_775_length_12397_cov_15.034071_12_plen_98_part_00
MRAIELDVEVTWAMTISRYMERLYTHRPTIAQRLADAPLPKVVTFEEGTGRIWEPNGKDDVLHPTDGHVDIVPPGLSTELTESKRIERAIRSPAEEL